MCYSNFWNDDCTLNIENRNYLKLLDKQDSCESRIPFSADPNNIFSKCQGCFLRKNKLFIYIYVYLGIVKELLFFFFLID